jgi:hypothetical protein
MSQCQGWACSIEVNPGQPAAPPPPPPSGPTGQGGGRGPWRRGRRRGRSVAETPARGGLPLPRRVPSSGRAAAAGSARSDGAVQPGVPSGKPHRPEVGRLQPRAGGLSRGRGYGEMTMRRSWILNPPVRSVCRSRPRQPRPRWTVPRRSCARGQALECESTNLRAARRGRDACRSSSGRSEGEDHRGVEPRPDGPGDDMTASTASSSCTAVSSGAAGAR